MRRTIFITIFTLCIILQVHILSNATTLTNVIQYSKDINEDSLPELTTEEKYALLSALYEANISDIREAIDLRLITCQELTAYYLERIEAYNQEYNCFITICDDAMKQAAEKDAAIANGTAEGALFGIPIVVKDNIHVEGYLTTNGYYKSDSYISSTNADIVDLLLEEGAIIIAKSNMSTAAQSARTSESLAVGETKNAYNSVLASGGSSGGSAVSTSLNFCVASLGTDTNSSLRIPAALNGCVSLRATTGLISTDNIIVLNANRDIPGAITRSVEDQAIMLDVLTDGAYNYYENLNSNALSGLKIGVLEELTYPGYNSERTQANIDSEVMETFQNAISELEACGAKIVYVSMPDIFDLSDSTYNTNSSSSIEYFNRVFEEFLTENNIDAVIFPSYLSTPVRSGTDENGVYWDAYSQTFVNNCNVLSSCAAVPEITVPIGTHSLGAGIGMEIATSQYNEQLLLDIAYSYTSIYNHREAPDGATDLYADYNKGSLSTRIISYIFSNLSSASKKTFINNIITPLVGTINDSDIIQPDIITTTYTTDEFSKENKKNNSTVFIIILFLIVPSVILYKYICLNKKRKLKRKRK